MSAFPSVIGHAHPKLLLARALTGRRRAHAYLFDGPRGIGKMRLAREFARSLQCGARGDRPDACAACANCSQMARGVHPYFFVLAPPADRKVIGINAVRYDFGEGEHPEQGQVNLERRMALKPWGATYKIVAFDDADTLSDEAANWLLKLLEEPPPQTIFLLVTAVPRHLPTTIRSRCQRVRFGSLAPDEARRALEAAAPDAAAAEREELLRLADGSPGVAAALRAEGAGAWIEPARAVFRDLARGRYAAGLDALAKQVNLKQVDAADRRRLHLLIGILAGEVASSLRGGAGDSPVRDWVQRAGPDRALPVLERLFQAQCEVAMNANPQIVLEAVFGSLADAATRKV